MIAALGSSLQSLFRRVNSSEIIDGYETKTLYLNADLNFSLVKSTMIERKSQ